MIRTFLYWVTAAAIISFIVANEQSLEQTGHTIWWHLWN